MRIPQPKPARFFELYEESPSESYVELKEQIKRLKREIKILQEEIDKLKEEKRQLLQRDSLQKGVRQISSQFMEIFGPPPYTEVEEKPI